MGKLGGPPIDSLEEFSYRACLLPGSGAFLHPARCPSKGNTRNPGGSLQVFEKGEVLGTLTIWNGQSFGCPHGTPAGEVPYHACPLPGSGPLNMPQQAILGTLGV